MTAQEFISAVQAGGTIDVDSDIDFNDYVFSSTIQIPANTTVNGNGHTLTNIQQTSGAIFNIQGALSVNRLNFRNFNLPSTSLFSTNGGGTKNFTECQFSGIAYYLLTGNNTSVINAATFNRCSITLDRYNILTANYNECYIVLSRNLTTNSQDMFGARMTHTYLKGQITMTGPLYLNTYMVGSCFNINVKGTNNSFFEFQNETGNEISVINKDKLEGFSLSPRSKTIGVTDAEMHDAAALYSKGFNIYVP